MGDKLRWTSGSVWVGWVVSMETLERSMFHGPWRECMDYERLRKSNSGREWILTGKHKLGSLVCPGSNSFIHKGTQNSF